MIGILTEKPSAKKNFEKALGGTIGTFNGQNYLIVCARGHLYEYPKNPHEMVPSSLQDKYKSWDIEQLPWNADDFQWRKQPKKGADKILDAIKKTLERCDEIVIATDVDPTGEGELLAWEILEELNLDNHPVSRMYFMDESEKSIQKAFLQRKRLSSMEEDGDFRKADTRCKSDYLSMQFTRIASNYAGRKCVLRQGRLKSPMVKLVGDQLKAIDEYKKVPYYQYRFKDENGNSYSDPDAQKYDTEDKVPNIFSESSVIIDGMVRKPKAPPKLMDLAALSAKLASKGYKAQEVLAAYQKMYEAQYVSYPRTEDKTITNEQFAELLPLASKIAQVVGVPVELLTQLTPRKTHVVDAGSHGANRPGPKVPVTLDELDQYGKAARDIYELLARSYLAMLAEDAVFDHQKGHLEKYPSYTAKVVIPVSSGYRQILDDLEDAEDEQKKEPKRLGKTARPYMFTGFPPKPVYPTMKWLMKKLDRFDVGTGATRTSIFAEITSTKHKYPLLAEKKGRLSMTDYGRISHRLLEKTRIGDVMVTKALFDQLKQVGQGKLNPQLCYQAMTQFVMHDLEVMKVNSLEMLKDPEFMTNYSDMATGLFQGKEISFRRMFSNHRFTDEEVKRLLNGETILIRNVKTKNGPRDLWGSLQEKLFNGVMRFGFEIEKNTVKGIWQGQSVEIKRSWGAHVFTEQELRDLFDGKQISFDYMKNGQNFVCSGLLGHYIFDGKEYLGFVRSDERARKSKNDTREMVYGLFHGQQVSFPRVFRGHRFSDREVQELLAGRLISIYNLVSKGKGKTYSCTGRLEWVENNYTKEKVLEFSMKGYINAPKLTSPL